MIPLHLRISGFLSYRDPAELDFTRFELACISGPNGAGKSTLLDAMTWALFGQARRRDDALINLQSDAAEVAFTFRYEDVDYRILRSLRRSKPGVLELQARQTATADGGPDSATEAAWRPLTERTQKETQARIEQVLRLDYETFVNASFFLQGKADLFAQHTPAKRKEVLGNILGMERWEEYKARALELRRTQETELESVSARLGEIGTELAEEPQRRQHLAELEAELARLAEARKSQATTLESIRKTHALLDRQRALLSQQAATLERARSDLGALQARLSDRRAAQHEGLSLTERGAEIEAAYTSWRSLIAELERWDGIARTFRDHQEQRLPLLQEIAAEEARLVQEHRQLSARGEELRAKGTSVVELESKLREATTALAEVQAQGQERQDLQRQLAAMRESIGGKASENKSLKEKMDELKSRLDALETASGAACPLCGQPLSDAHRQSTLKTLRLEGKQLGDQYRANTAAVQQLQEESTQVEARISALADIEERGIRASQTAAQLSERLQAIKNELTAWEKDGRGRLEEVKAALDAGRFAEKTRAKLDKLDTQLAKLGYDAAAHDAARGRELQQRPAEQQYADLRAARAALAPLEDEIRSLEKQISERGAALHQSEAEVQQTQAALESASADLPDLVGAERALFDLQEKENGLNQEVGAARQKVTILQDLRTRGAELETARQQLALSVGRYKRLEGAFGKDGVQALLIEQALPELESRTNEILDRLSDGRMSVHFETQAPYRDRKREDLRETLDIVISDGAGKREYEMYSGGEAFRVNFAIRLALSQVLAGRKGARLQTLVIDEGFASQDSQGIQRLIESINLVRDDFAKILLISHLEELKDAFPTRIEVEKTERGSVLRVS